MNLYETLGLVAAGAGLGSAVGYAGGSERPLIQIAAAVVVGAIACVVIFLRLRSTVTHLKQPTERTLAILYVLTFFKVLLATWMATFGALSITGNFNR
jgi:hypothetical protein